MPLRNVAVKNRSSGEVLLPKVRWCSSYLSRLRGLMFRSKLEPGEALILVEARDSRTATAIHMFNVPFAIAAVWIDSQGCVVDKVEALPWRPFYGPRAPARYVLETAPEFLNQITIGDRLVFEDSAA